MLRPGRGEGGMSRPLNVLFLCTGNSARSIMAEAILNRESGGRFRAFSAGSFPKGQVHSAALGLLAELGHATDGFRSKSWDEFAAPGAPELDFIVTVCDNAAGEICPVWPGKPVSAHWGIEDPAEFEGESQRAAFFNAYQQLKRRIDLFLALPLESLDEITLSSRLKDIGRAGDSNLEASASAPIGNENADI
jgi:arsenate reductase (thioredoxin)